MSLNRHDRTTSRLTEVFRKATSAQRYQNTLKTATSLSLRLTAEERTRLKEQAGGQPLGAYIHSRLLGEKVEKRRYIRQLPSPDHKKLALILAELGRSRLPSNMNQLARAANMGTLDVSGRVIGDIQEACRAIAAIRELLISALGIKPEIDEPSCAKATED